MSTKFRKERLITEINITPFTDVILVLLIIFMIVTPLIFQAAIRVNLPQTASASEELPKTVTITISKIGQAFIEGEDYSLRYDLGIFKSKLAALVEKNKNTSAIINADEKAEYAFVVKVMDLVNQVGIKHILLGVKLGKP